MKWKQAQHGGPSAKTIFIFWKVGLLLAVFLLMLNPVAVHSSNTKQEMNGWNDFSFLQTKEAIKDALLSRGIASSDILDAYEDTLSVKAPTLLDDFGVRFDFNGPNLLKMIDLSYFKSGAKYSFAKCEALHQETLELLITKYGNPSFGPRFRKENTNTKVIAQWSFYDGGLVSFEMSNTEPIPNSIRKFQTCMISIKYAHQSLVRTKKNPF